MSRQCPFCHEQVSLIAYAQHIREHEKLRPDGQQQEHATLPPEERATGDLARVSRVYFHSVCGVQTGMPEEIVRSYLVNPFLYTGGTFCCGCNGYVKFSSVTWTETGQSLQEYFDELRAQAIAEGRGPKQASPLVSVSILILLFATLGGGALAQSAKWNAGLGLAAGAAVGGVCTALMWIGYSLFNKGAARPSDKDPA
jgi:hypothetical protein